MKCFTVFEQSIYKGITVVNGNGIGYEGLFAHVPTDNKIFPAPEFERSINNFIFPGSKPSPIAIFNADVYLFRGLNLEGKRCQYEAMLYAEQNKNSNDALIMWVVSLSGPNNCRKVTDHNCKLFDETTRFGGYWHMLTRMKPKSNITLHTNAGDVTLTWNGTDLNINKTSK